uniref:F-box domain-containing protein n=1 Tax=Arundo donax TaxID=35708 RepID=A0A0A9G9W8_ARUDO
MASVTADPPLPDEILEDIFLRLDAAADLTRASAACTSFRRVVSARRFLRLFRSLHARPLLACIGSTYPEFYPAEPPHRSAPAAAALARAADFTFSFFEAPNNWSVRDACNGRLLLSPRCYEPEPFEYLVVCDPLHRRYVQIPPIPTDLAAASSRRRRRHRALEFEPFLDAASEEEKEQEEGMPFRVICNVLYKSKVVALVFSSVTGKWRAAATFSYEYAAPFVRHYTHDCFYWTHCARNLMLVLNPREMKFSVVDLPPYNLHRAVNLRDRAIVDAGGGRLGLLTFDSEGRYLELYSKTMGNIDAEDWQHDKIIPLPDCHWYVVGAAEGYLVLHGIQRDWFTLSMKNLEKQYFTVELKTFLVERLCTVHEHIHCAHPYASFPPPLSLPSI